MVEVINKTKSRINLKLVEGVCKKFFKYYRVKKDVSIAFVGDAAIRKLNKKYRKIDKATDVLAFPDSEDDYLGEIIIDYAQIKRQAKRFSGSVKKELIFILVHGLLHLLGYEDKTEKGRREMERLGKEFVKIFIKFL